MIKENDCDQQCYMQQRFYVSHSHKKEDLSKVAYRVIGRKRFIKSLNLSLKADLYSYKVNDNSNACCCYFTGQEIKDGFNLEF